MTVDTCSDCDIVSSESCTRSRQDSTVLVRVKVEATDRRIPDYLVYDRNTIHMNEPI
jgi:hypothetical protein